MREVWSAPRLNKKKKKMYNIIVQNCNGISKQVWSARKEHRCDFCGRKIFKGEPYVSTVDFIEHCIVKSCDKCGQGIIALYGD